MTTLALLKARIVSDLAGRTDLTTPIANAINDAIDYYQANRFYFNETRGSTFATVAAQSRYSSSDDADIPEWVKLDGVFLIDSDSNTYPLSIVPDPTEMEWMLDASAASGRPYEYAYFDQSFWLYPIPDAVYTIRPLGAIKKAAPASDSEASNVWMTEAFELLRCAAKRYIAMHTIIDPNLLNNAAAGERLALSRLRSETTYKVGSDRIQALPF